MNNSLPVLQKPGLLSTQFGNWYPFNMGLSKTISTIILFAITIQAGLGGTLSDTDKEQRWAEQVIDTLFDGEAVWLNAGGHDFLAIEMEASEGPVNKAVIVVHGSGIHPNWDQVVRPLRVGLAENGWHTLSIQMPILPNDAEPMDYRPLFKEVPGRFDAAIDYLQSTGITHITIASLSMGSAMTSYYMARNPDSPVQALVLVGTDASSENSPVDTVANIGTIGVPVLDLYGSEDLPGVINSAPERIKAASDGGNLAYRQVMVDGANHFFDDREEELLNHVSNWLEELP